MMAMTEVMTIFKSGPANAARLLKQMLKPFKQAFPQTKAVLVFGLQVSFPDTSRLSAGNFLFSFLEPVNHILWFISLI